MGRMKREVRVVLAVAAAGLLGAFAAPLGCVGEQHPTEQGKVGQYCYADMTCNPGLTCLAIETEAGPDGGQCFCLDDSGCVDAAPPEAGDAGEASARDAGPDASPGDARGTDASPDAPADAADADAGTPDGPTDSGGGEKAPD